MSEFVYSVRMRASLGGHHVSGAERLIDEADVDDAVAALNRRARDRTDEPDFVQITVERIPRADVGVAQVLKLILTPPSTPSATQVAASIRLGEIGVSNVAIERGFELLRDGIDGRSARGAILLDASTGANLTPDIDRGVRASSFDYKAGSGVDRVLIDAGLSHFRTREALALATKVVWSGVLAELCWSDDAEYVAGYVGTTEGYVRYADFKPDGAVGGRAFFIDTHAVTVESVVENLQRRALWIEGPLEIEGL